MIDEHVVMKKSEAEVYLTKLERFNQKNSKFRKSIDIIAQSNDELKRANEQMDKQMELATASLSQLEEEEMTAVREMRLLSLGTYNVDNLCALR